MTTPQAAPDKRTSVHRLRARSSARNPGEVEELLQGLDATEPRHKFGCAKALCHLSGEQPALLYPHFDAFVRLLDHENKILQWGAIHVLSHLAGVDTEDRFAAVFDRYFSPISGPVMITAANVIKGSARIARARPRWADRIAAEVLKVTRGRYRTAECRNIAIGHAIVALEQMLDLVNNRAPVLRFVRGQLNNPRPATRHKAEHFLKRLASHAKTAQA